MRTIRNTLVLIVACTLGAVGLIVPATATAAGPNIELSKEQPAQGLLGTPQEVTLRASNPKGEERAYNLTLRDVLPKGVVYVGPARGSDGSALEPKVLEDAPNEGETTLIFENVADLSGNSHYALTFQVEATSPEYTVGDTYTDEAGAYVNEDARLLPKFDAEGRAEPGSFTGSAADEASTTLTAVEIKKTEPSPEQELLRGVHEHQTVYTLKLINNDVGPRANSRSTTTCRPASSSSAAAAPTTRPKRRPTPDRRTSTRNPARSSPATIRRRRNVANPPWSKPKKSTRPGRSRSVSTPTSGGPASVNWAPARNSISSTARRSRSAKTR